MSLLRQQIEFYPPGLIIIRGSDEAAAFIQELPRNVIKELGAKGYCFFVLPEGVSIDVIPDEVLEKAFRERQRARKPVLKLDKDGMN